MYCFLLALSKDQIHAFTATRDGEEWSQRVYKQKVERTSLCCRTDLTGDRSHRGLGPCSKFLGCLPVDSSWRGMECLWNRTMNRRMISSVSATTPRGPKLLLTREMEEMGGARETLSSSSNHHPVASSLPCRNSAL